MKSTVILCTYNRCQSLAKALESVVGSVLPGSAQWEVLVVDNNSKDATRAVADGFCYRFPGRFRYIFEPKQGKSYALNTGIAQATGDVLVFTDDDVEVDPNWLHNLTSGFDGGNWAGAGGRILPEAGFVPQKWMDLSGRSGLAPLAMFDLGPEPGELKEPPFGANMAFRKNLFAKYGTFRTDLGPQPGSEIRSEDSEFGSRLLASGECLRYEPSAIVYHAIAPNRNRREYFETWWFDKGRADVRESGIPMAARWCIAGVPLYLLRRLVMGTLRWTMNVHEPRRFSRKLGTYWLRGMILECYKQVRRT